MPAGLDEISNRIIKLDEKTLFLAFGLFSHKVAPRCEFPLVHLPSLVVAYKAGDISRDDVSLAAFFFNVEDVRGRRE